MYIVIPARYASSRLPGKPLADVCGQPLIQRVYECARATGAKNIIVATDDERVQQVAKGFGAVVCLTSSSHRSGTDRLAEVVESIGINKDEIVVNLQGDEPLMPAELINKVADTLVARPAAVMATACHPVDDFASFQDPNVVKVICDRDGYALYFSRAPIPWPRESMNTNIERQWPHAGIPAYRHIGIYAYRAGFISRYTAWQPCELEQVEQLEQLRVLWNGERIAVCMAEQAPPAGVDTPDDLERVRRWFSTKIKSAQ